MLKNEKKSSELELCCSVVSCFSGSGLLPPEASAGVAVKEIAKVSITITFFMIIPQKNANLFCLLELNMG
ncbi:hypothetical protein [Planctobacterium marinum]|uniref:Uncharacterized protein n=1 Tax=Planctobacterium marinum TaxID=1631968 RepID=A0AA48HSU2_9ALTE|nr:hypothetical protein MACH26_28700 [Planctobacterium marinum]